MGHQKGPPPPVQEFLDAAPKESVDHLTVREQRQRIRQLSDLNYNRFGRRAEAASVATDHTVPVDRGEITVRAYRPSTQGPLPGHVELHGGGWWLGSIDEHVNEAICRYRCVHAYCVVFAVEYRLAPEHPFPTAVNDVYAALHWIVGHATELGLDASRISIRGTSAGGDPAAALTLLAPATPRPQPVLQPLELPSPDLTGETMRAGRGTQEPAPHPAPIARVEKR